MTDTYTEADVMSALKAVEPATTSRVFNELSDRPYSGAKAAKRRRDWLWRTLLKMARAGRVSYIIEGRTYVWRSVT